MSVLIRLSETL